MKTKREPLQLNGKEFIYKKIFFESDSNVY